MKRLSVMLFVWIGAVLFLAGCTDEEEPIQQAPDEENGQEEAAENMDDGVTDESQADEEVIGLAESFIEDLSQGEYSQAAEKFDTTMSEQVGENELEELWGSLEEQLGGFIDYEYHRTETVDGYQVVMINGVFNDADATFQVTVDENHEIAGFYIQ